ncbi:MAG: hypothetical protein JWN86_3824 [Planctomycetota bacterium]|nr:hypothetical protein [Planctomycetota bacterium]
MPRPVSRRDRRHARPYMEGLEDRKLLYATLGASWTFGSRITYSFAPDGTNIGGNSSTLFQTMSNRGFTTSQWQSAIQKAAASWESAANLNLVLVSDDGSSFGAAGNQQGDSRFGDIRIGGASLASNVLASCFLPPAFNGGTLAGDIVINTAQAWQINSDYDLQTVAMHEFGHALGLDHSTVSYADMYSSYNAIKQTLTSDDIAGIQSIYGTRAADAFDAAASNGSYSTASNINSYVNSNAQVTLSSLDITSASDSDWYVVNAPANTSGTLTVTMQSSNLSSLSPKLTLYNSSLAVLSTVQSIGSFGATVTTIAITGVTSGQKFYIKSQAAGGLPTGIGAYGLLVNFGTGTMDPVAPPNTVVASQADHGGGSTNENTGDEPVQIGNLSAWGDSLGVSTTFRQAIALVDGSLDLAGLALPFGEDLTIRFLVGIWHAAERNNVGTPAARAAVIHAIDDVLATWGRT